MTKTELYDFIDQYNGFWERVLEEEKQRAVVLSSGDLEQIQKSIQEQQAIIMQIKNLEEKRMAMEEELGLAGMSFREVIADAQEEFKPRLEASYEKFKSLIDEIKFYNEKSNKIAKEHLDFIGKNEPKENLSSGAYGQKDNSKGEIFGAKI